MARYFFWTEDGACFPDEEGVELPDIRAAQLEATRHLGDFLRHSPDELWKTGDFRVIVKDVRGLTLFVLEVTTIAAAAALHHSPKQPANEV